MVSVGTIVWLASELMFFAGLFAMYFTIRSVQGPEVWLESTEMLNIPYSSVNTLILVLSSVTCQLGVFAAERGDVRRLRIWFVITFVMGTVFVVAQVYEYIQLVERGPVDLVERVRLRLLPDHRIPWSARHRRADRLLVRARPDLRRKALHP